MTFLPWSEEYSVSVRVIDNDHRVLFDIVNALHDGIQRGDSHDVIGGTLDALAKYVAQHFEREERYMRECGYPELKEHIQKHRKLSGHVNDLVKKYRAAPETFDTDVLLKFLKDWLIHHILKSDMHYAPYVRGEKKGLEGAERQVQSPNTISVTVKVPADKRPIIQHCAEILTEGGPNAEALETLIRGETSDM